ncbi:hypothetical protein [Paludisphaera sp.]|uniref:hypothetical protein n=1 Tax=Paludisphaera sp. TaxID=2017432 RepID=UPI00301C4221
MTNDLDGPRAECPHCSARVRVRPEHVGRPAGCPLCGGAIDTTSLIGSGSGSGEVPAGAAAGAEPGGHVETTCPDCGAGLRVRARYLGRHVRCGVCRFKFRVEPSRASVLDAPADPTVDDRQDPALAPTPDPDDPWRGRVEVMRLLGEIAGLKRLNARLASEVERLERERDAARDAAAGPGRPAPPIVIPFDHGGAPFLYHVGGAAGTTGG